MKRRAEHRDPVRFARAVEHLTESHRSRGIPAVRPGRPLPSMRAVVGILRELEALLFPADLDPSGCASVVECCDRIFDPLREQIERALVAGNSATPEQAQAQAEPFTLELLEALPSIREVVYEDANAAVEGDPAAHSLTEVILSYPSVRAIGTYRVAHFLHTRRVPLLPRMMTEYVHGRTGIDIHPGARIGPGVFIDHGTGVVIGETAVIGRGCKLYQGVTLGALSVRKHGDEGWNPPQRHPTLEDFVTVYAHATILGGDTVIGEGSVIGGNVWLTRSVPPQTRVLIDPPNLLYRSAPGAPVKEPIDYQI